MTKRKLKPLQLFLLMMFLAFSCTERFDIVLDDSYTQLVVDGTISTDTTAHTIRLSTSSSYFSNDQPPAVTEAQVYLDDGFNKTKLTEIPAASGIYATPPNYYGIPGHTYTLEINLEEAIGGYDYYTAEAKMPTTDFSLSHIELEWQERFELWIVKLFAYDPPSLDYYKFDIKRNGLLITDTASRATAIDDRLFNGNQTNGMGVLFMYLDEVHPGDTLTFIMSSIPKDYYDFFIELRNESGGFSSPLFSGPPANIRSNLEEGGLGYFAVRKSKSVQYIMPESLSIKR